MGSPGYPAHSSRTGVFYAPALRGRDCGDVQSTGNQSRRWNPAELRLRIHCVSVAYLRGLVQVSGEVQFSVGEGTWWVTCTLGSETTSSVQPEGFLLFWQVECSMERETVMFSIGKTTNVCRSLVYVHTYKHMYIYINVLKYKNHFCW